MIARVSEQGVMVPKRMLGNAAEVELREEPGRIVIVLDPAKDPVVLDPAKDPIRRLGKNPVIAPESDASINHDKYVYGT